METTMNLTQKILTATALFAVSLVPCLAANANEIQVDDFTDQTTASTTVYDDGTFVVERVVSGGFVGNLSKTGFTLVSTGSGVGGTISYSVAKGTFGDLAESLYGPGSDATGFHFGYALSGLFGVPAATVTLDYGGGASAPIDLAGSKTPFTVSDSAIDSATSLSWEFSAGDLNGAVLTVGTTPFAVTATIPEPTSLILFGSLIGAASIGRRRRG